MTYIAGIHCNRRSILFAIMGYREEGTCFLINVHSFVFTLHSTLIRDSTLRDHQAWKVLQSYYFFFKYCI